LPAGLSERRKIAVVMLQIVNILNYIPSCLPITLEADIYSRSSHPIARGERVFRKEEFLEMGRTVDRLPSLNID
jgi:hypothetical protein